MATLDTLVDRSTGSQIAGKAYFETSTNKFIVWNGESWIELHSDGVGALDPYNIDIVDTEANILASTGYPDGTIARVTNSFKLYVYQGGAWYVFNAEPFSKYSLSLDGSNDYAELGTSVKNYFDGVQGVSVRAVFKMPSLTTTNRVVFGQESTNTGDNSLFTVRVNSSNKIDIIFKNSSGSYFIIPWETAISANTWYDVVAVFDGSSSEVLLYVNGDLKNTKDTVTGTSYTSSSNAKFRFGATGHSTFLRSFNGIIDEGAIFNTALSASDITAIYNSGVPTDLSVYSPVGWWRMGDNDNGTGTTVTDQGSGGNDATLINGASFSTDVPS